MTSTNGNPIGTLMFWLEMPCCQIKKILNGWVVYGDDEYMPANYVGKD